MAWIEVYGQRSLAFEQTTAILWVERHKKCALGAMATMDDYVSSHFKWNSHITLSGGSWNNCPLLMRIDELRTCTMIAWKKLNPRSPCLEQY